MEGGASAEAAAEPWAPNAQAAQAAEDSQDILALMVGEPLGVDFFEEGEEWQWARNCWGFEGWVPAFAVAPVQVQAVEESSELFDWDALDAAEAVVWPPHDSFGLPNPWRRHLGPAGSWYHWQQGSAVAQHDLPGSWEEEGSCCEDVEVEEEVVPT